MKKTISVVSLLGCLIGYYSCSESENPAPEVPEITLSAVSYLEFTVNGENCPAAFQLLPDGGLSDTMVLQVTEPSTEATVKAVTLIDPGITINIAEGEKVTFVNNVLAIILSNGSVSKTYYVEMRFSEGAANDRSFLYLVKTSDSDGSGRYYLNTTTAEKLFTTADTDIYEGYVDLTATDWDNIGLVTSDLRTLLNVNDGFYPEVSFGSFTLVETEQAEGNLYYPTDGPWADWLWTGGNASIISPGVWKLNYNASTKLLELLEVQWAITGTATGGQAQAMTYISATKIWSITAELSAGNISFATIPVSEADPVVAYKAASSTQLAAEGNDIAIPSAGSYTIKIYLSISPYSYEVTKN
jgi:hypothetical protein